MLLPVYLHDRPNDTWSYVIGLVISHTYYALLKGHDALSPKYIITVLLHYEVADADRSVPY